MTNRQASTPKVVRYQPGKMLFHEGEVGGELMLIKQGTVEIFTLSSGQPVVLTEMGPGEVLGVMTCLNGEPRLASAKAKDEVEVQLISREAIQRTLTEVPEWIGIVIKEFTLRIKQMNERYGRSIIMLKRSQTNQRTLVHLATQFAASFVNLSEHLARAVDDYKVVEIDPMLEALENGLCTSKQAIAKIYAALEKSGVIRVELEPDRKKRVTRLNFVRRLSEFCKFVEESRQGQKKKWCAERFNHKEIRTMMSMCRFAQQIGMNPRKSCRIATAQLSEAMEKKTGTAFQLENLTRAHRIGLLEIEGQDEDCHIKLEPATLSFTLTCLDALRRLEAESVQDSAKKDNTP